MKKILFIFLSLFCLNVHAGQPLWTFEPLTATTITVPANTTAVVQYLVRNMSSKSHTLSMQAMPAMTQLTGGPGICPNPFTLEGRASCVLSLQINGSALTKPITNGPIICQRGSGSQCYRPSMADILRVTPAPADNLASISLSGSSLTLVENGPTGFLIVLNNSTDVTATNIAPILTGTALDGNVAVVGNTCASLAPNASCTISFSPGSTPVPTTSFPIQGDNTNTVTADITIDPGSSLISVSPNSGAASGGASVVLTGTGFTGATSVTFGGIAATSVTVLSSTAITAVTPANTVGVVDVAITTPFGSATLTNAYTYIATAVGQPVAGGIIGCLGGGLQDLIVSSVNNSVAINWGGAGTTVGASSTTDGAANTMSIVTTLGANGGVPYAAKLCDDYEVDSQGNTPCLPGNTCYNDWYLAATNQTSCLYTNRADIGGYDPVDYWTSTENPSFPALSAFLINFDFGSQSGYGKNLPLEARCVRSFTP